jgi:hypothetical protein
MLNLSLSPPWESLPHPFPSLLAGSHAVQVNLCLAAKASTSTTYPFQTSNKPVIRHGMFFQQSANHKLNRQISNTLGRSVLVPQIPHLIQHPRDEDRRGEKDDVDEQV